MNALDLTVTKKEAYSSFFPFNVGLNIEGTDVFIPNNLCLIGVGVYPAVIVTSVMAGEI